MNVAATCWNCNNSLCKQMTFLVAFHSVSIAATCWNSGTSSHTFFPCELGRCLLRFPFNSAPTFPLQSAPTPVDPRTDGKTPLLIACSRGNVSIVQMLLDARADVNKADLEGVTPLFAAA